MTNKERYRLLCESEGANIPLFQQYWWMETVCHGKQWDVLLSVQANGFIDGALPFLFGSKFGMYYVLQPQLTQYSGPWFHHHPRTGDPVEFEHHVAEDLVSQLDRLHLSVYLQRFSPTITDWLPFYWHGYKQTTRYTYRFDPLPDPATLATLADRGRKRQLASVREAYTLDRQVGAEEFVALHRDYWERRSGSDLLSHDFLLRVVTTAMARNQALIYGLRNADGQLVAARFVVYDDRCAYALLSAMRPDALRNSMTLLVWTLLEELHGRTQAFDFEGSMDNGIEHFYRSFGARQVPYFEVSRFANPLLSRFVSR
ncbi:MAG: GNAT family N-acetyltransferase [Bacteroidales bacterium]|nr:GNAT family N-acetyltransferase [Bacteroidales bacterium]